MAALVTHIVRWATRTALLRYVDDKFAPERRGTVAHATDCVVRVIQALLGQSSVSPKKVEHGEELIILGLRVRVCPAGFHAMPAEAKRARWQARISKALEADSLTPGECSKLVGALSWAGSAMFRRIGRALLRPLYSHSHGRRARLSEDTRLALRWWLHVLTLNLHQERAWSRPTPDGAADDPFVLLADARSTPPRVAAILVSPTGEIEFCELVPSAQLLSCFKVRNDGAIMALELLAVAVGVCTFADRIANKKVRILSDNTGAESTLRKGSSREFDYACISHGVWCALAKLSCEAWIDRVPTKENWADLPSRESRELLFGMGGTQCHGVLWPEFYEPAAWDSLALGEAFSR